MEQHVTQEEGKGNAVEVTPFDIYTYFFIYQFTYNTFLELECYAEPRTDDRKLLCANGDLVDTWGGCYDAGSVRVQCPKGHYPCNSLRKDSKGKEFICSTNCDKHGGGKRDCYL